ncbi:MAG: tRNA lysidine(34) synthetase TilS [Lachnospiraceae bacterium]|nr:tRNA lysidine(34) synthetase TilS [Lachnospiraceae bacterium]MBR3003754.1 tRNA lysidine(34) synthetase TilS [Lachnospiraceae bacterium]MBR6350499.1 tRNA lysidine(34) synthetase TilS [Lachnospiraceae bacterium]
MTKNIEQLFTDYVKEHHMINRGDRIVIGVSGGADSVCLLFLMNKLSRILEFSITAVHVNHMLRGEESDRDERFVKSLCHKHGIKCVTVNIDVRSLAFRQGLSKEEAGRIARYRAFEAVARKLSGKNPYKGGKACVAHHIDDNVETVLMNMMRGAGLKGICGIQPVSRWGTLTIIRPLLCLSREDIENYLRENRLDYVHDSTNSQDDFTRNKVRLNILPQMKSINPRTPEHINDTAQTAYLVWNYYQQQVREATKAIVDQRDIAPTINVQKLGFLDPAIQNGIIYNTIGQVAGTFKNITHTHVTDVLSLMDKQTGRRINLPYGIVALRSYSNIIIKKETSYSASDRQDFGSGPLISAIDSTVEIPLSGLEKGGRVYSLRDGGTIRFSIVDVNDDNRRILTENKIYTKAFDCDKIKNTLLLARPQPDDEISFKGGRKSLKKYFVDAKIPQEIRDTIPVLKDVDGVIWVLGYRIGENYKITDRTRRALLVEIREGKNERQD